MRRTELETAPGREDRRSSTLAEARLHTVTLDLGPLHLPAVAIEIRCTPVGPSAHAGGRTGTPVNLRPVGVRSPG